MRTPLLRPRPRRIATAAAAAVALVALVPTIAVAAPTEPTRPSGLATAAAPEAIPGAIVLAAPSPDLPGLPPVSLELADIPVDGAAYRRALARYQAADQVLADAQGARVELDRSLAVAAAAARRLRADLAAAEARRSAAQARLDDVEAAIADLGVRMYVSGGSAARLDAAVADEHPSINDQDRQAVLGAAALDVLLAERDAYTARRDEAVARAEASRDALAELDRRAGSLSSARPAAAEAEAAAAPPVANERVRYEEARVLATVDGVDFQLVALDAYQRAARVLRQEDPSCGLRWWGLAGISRVEGRHGTYGGARLDQNGDTSRRIVGIQLDGTRATQVVADTDGGALDGDPVYDRAVGPMQFIPETWRRFASDGNDDAVESPFNLYDSALAAGRYLCLASAGLDTDAGLRQAYFSYNHSDAYVVSVLGWARRYEGRVTLPDPST